jgi:predicted DNA-binding protein
MVEVSILNMTKQDEDWSAAQYPDAIRFRMPRGFRERVKQAAQAERVPASEFIRRAIGERVERLSADWYKHSALAYVLGA